MQAFFNTITQFTELSPESSGALAAVLSTYQLPKGRTLIKPGTISENTYFIEEGLTRTYYFKDGRDITDWLAAEGEIAGSVISFLTRQPDRRGVELLEPSTVVAIRIKHSKTFTAFIMK